MRQSYSRRKSDLTSADPISWPLTGKYTVPTLENGTLKHEFKEFKECNKIGGIEEPKPVVKVIESSSNSYSRIVRQCNFCQILYSSFHTCRSSSSAMMVPVPARRHSLQGRDLWTPLFSYNFSLETVAWGGWKLFDQHSSFGDYFLSATSALQLPTIEYR